MMSFAFLLDFHRNMLWRLFWLICVWQSSAMTSYFSSCSIYQGHYLTLDMIQSRFFVWMPLLLFLLAFVTLLLSSEESFCHSTAEKIGIHICFWDVHPYFHDDCSCCFGMSNFPHIGSCTLFRLVCWWSFPLVPGSPRFVSISVDMISHWNVKFPSHAALVTCFV